MVGETMKVKNRDVVLAFQALTRIGNMPLAPRTAYWMGRNWNYLMAINNKIEIERGEIIKKYGTLDEKTNLVTVMPSIEKDGEQIPNPLIETVTAELAELVDREVEIVIHMLPLSGFQGSLSYQDASALDFMIEDDQPSNLIKLPMR
jgi:hypothetical protein